MNTPINIALVIPCYNEFNRINLNSIHNYLKEFENLSICFVNDGSTDQTNEILNKFITSDPDRLKLISLSKNEGKAEAVRQGVLYLHKNFNFEWIGFWDADLSTPINELNLFTEQIKKKQTLQFLLGSRVKRLGSTIERSIMRHYFGRIFATIASEISGIPVYDSQCGAKLIHRELIPIAFEEKFITKWIFDVEILIRFRNHFGLKKLLEICYEVPLSTWIDPGGSKIKLKHLLKVPVDFIKIHFKYNRIK